LTAVHNTFVIEINLKDVKAMIIIYSSEVHNSGYKTKITVFFSVFHRSFFISIINKTPTHALFNQHCISLVC